MKMLRKTMIALCAVASVAALTPNMALARGGGGGGGGGGGHGGGGGGFGGHAGGFSGGGFGGGSFAARGVGGGNFSNSFARAPATGNVNVGAVQGNHFASGNFGRMGRGGFDHGFRHGRHFFVGGAYYDGYWDYPDYAYDDSYYDNGSCYVVQQRVHTSHGWRVRPVQVCS
jgi:hypothetical protein